MNARLYKKKLGMVAENEMLAKRATFRVCRENFLNHALSNIGKCIFRRTFTIKEGLWSTTCFPRKHSNVKLR